MLDMHRERTQAQTIFVYLAQSYRFSQLVGVSVRYPDVHEQSQ